MFSLLNLLMLTPRNKFELEFWLVFAAEAAQRSIIVAVPLPLGEFPRFPRLRQSVF